MAVLSPLPRDYTKNEKSKDFCKADLKQRVLFFTTIFRLAIPAFFRFTDVTDYTPLYTAEHRKQRFEARASTPSAKFLNDK